METSNERWGITASTPPINPAEVESGQSAVEVVVMWGENVLHVEHVSPPRDVMLDDTIGDIAEPFPIVIEREGRLFCVLPDGATGTVHVADDTKTFDALREEGKLTHYAEIEGAWLYALPDGATAQIDHDGLSFIVRPTYAGKTIAAQAPVAWRRHTWIAVSVGVHAFFLVLFYFLPPTTSALSLDTISATDRMVEYLDTAPSVDPIEEEVTWEEDSGEAAGDPGQAHVGESGDAGREDAPQTDHRAATQGNDETPEMARNNIRENMENTGAIGALATLMGSWNTPTSPFGADRASGRDDFNAMGELLGLTAGDSHGSGGLGMHGTGVGAGGTGEGTFGVGELGTIGSCRGRRCSHGPGGGYGGSQGGLSNDRDHVDVRGIRSEVRVLGSLSREAIRRVVRRNIRQVRFCYEQGLVQNPSIEGRVTISWTIDPNGRVQSSNVSASSLHNARVESCIAGAVRRWSFPAPDGGPVGVNYPFMLNSND